MSQAALYRRTKEEQKEPTNNKYYQAASSSSTTTVRKYPETPSSTRQMIYRLQLERIKKMHQDYLGRPMPAPLAAKVLQDIDAGTPAEYYMYALTESCYAPRPSWRYAAAIVNRCKDQLIEPEDLEY